MKLPKKYMRLILFARFLDETNLGQFPRQAVELLQLADRAFRAGERECNQANYDATPHRERFEALAKVCRLKVQWPGLLPTVIYRLPTRHVLNHHPQPLETPMRGYVIVRDDGQFVRPPGNERSYTRLLQEAWLFLTRDRAEAERCPGNERVVSVADIMEQDRNHDSY